MGTCLSLCATESTQHSTQTVLPVFHCILHKVITAQFLSTGGQSKRETF